MISMKFEKSEMTTKVSILESALVKNFLLRLVKAISFKNVF